MYDDLAAYFHENVVPSYLEFVESINDGSSGVSEHLRAAINSATVLYHVREHLPQGHQKSRKEVANACPEYDLVADIVNASKHGQLTRGSPQIVKADDIQELMILTQYADEAGEYFSAEHAVVTKLIDGSTRNVGEILASVINYWGSLFHILGIINNPTSFTYARPNHPLTREEVDGQKNDLKMIKGVRFKQAMVLQEYNYQTGMVSPIDLTGSQLKFSIYEPPKHTLVINLEHNETGNVMAREIEIDHDEYQKFESIQSDQEKQEFLSAIANKSSVMEELVSEAKDFEHNNRIHSDAKKKGFLRRLAFWRR
jgi:hypothetical protein